VEALSEPVSGVMTPDPIFVKLGTRLGEVLETFADERVGALLVVDEAERLRGILSYVDLLLWLRDHPWGGGAAPPQPGAAGRPAVAKAKKPKKARRGARKPARQSRARRPVRRRKARRPATRRQRTRR
jgi:hypothetical protein